MAHIDIKRTHSLSAKKARVAAEAAGKRLADEFGLQYHWDEKVLRFERSGVEGHLELTRTSVHIVVTLGFLLLPFRNRIEQEIQRNLSELFDE